MCEIPDIALHRYFAEVMGFNPVEALIFFRLLLSSCLNRKIYSDEHSSNSFSILFSVKIELAKNVLW